MIPVACFRQALACEFDKEFTMADDCIFCKIIKGDVPSAKVYEDERILAFLDVRPVSEGHCLVVPKEHYDRLDECPADTVAAIGSKIGRIAQAVVSVTDAEGFNILNNNGRCAGQLVAHVHFHIIPRRTGDGIFIPWPAKKYPDGRAEELARNIKNILG
jgi:histidine triad (HIT) family protein